MELALKAGPLLAHCSYATGEHQEDDVTAQASLFLFSPVRVEEGVRLRDVLLLLAADRRLCEVFARDWAQELLAEALRAPEEPQKTDQEIEYLELRQQWHQDTSTGEIQPMHRLDLRGVGVVQKEDCYEHGVLVCKAGERFSWGVSLSPLGELLHLPIRICPEVAVFEDNIDSVNYAKQIGKARHEGVTLGQLLHSVLWELSFHGAPEDREAVKNELVTQMERIEAGEATTVPMPDLFEEDRQRLMTYFTDPCGLDAEQLLETLMQLPDEQDAQEGFRQLTGQPVCLGADYASMTGRQLRRHLRETRSSDWVDKWLSAETSGTGQTRPALIEDCPEARARGV